MNDDRAAIIRELERGGWQISPSGNLHIGIHPDADRPIRFGGSYGWTFNRIRADAARALGAGKRPDRKHLDKSHRRSELAAAHDARRTHLDQCARDRQREHDRRLVLQRYDELSSLSSLMRTH